MRFQSIWQNRSFPSPCRGLIFLTRKKDYLGEGDENFRPLAGDLSSLRYNETCKSIWKNVSVPLQGTYLPYQDAIALEINGEMVSVPLQGTYLPYSRTVTGTDYFFRPFPSPCRGLIFLTKKNITVNTQRESFRPLAGDLSSLQNY